MRGLGAVADRARAPRTARPRRDAAGTRSLDRPTRRRAPCNLGSSSHGNFPGARGAAGPGNFPGAARHWNPLGHGGAKGMSQLLLLSPPRGRGRGCPESLLVALNGASLTGDPPVPPPLGPLGGTPGPWQRWVLPTRGGTQPEFAGVWPQGRRPEIQSLPILIFN